MFGAMEILLIAVIFGIIYGRDAIDKTFRKNPNEGTVESLAWDLKDYYKENPKRMTYLVIGIGLGVIFLIVGTYYTVTHTRFLRMIGLR